LNAPYLNLDDMLDNLADYFRILLTPFITAGQEFAVASLVILGLTATIKGILIILEQMFDGEALSDSITKLARGFVLVGVMMLALANWGQIQSFSIALTADVARIFNQAFAASISSASAPLPQQMFSQSPGNFPMRLTMMPNPNPDILAQNLAQHVIQPVNEDLGALTSEILKFYQVRVQLELIVAVTGRKPPPNTNIYVWANQEMEALRNSADGFLGLLRLLGSIQTFLAAGLVILGAAFLGIVAGTLFALFALYWVVGGVVVLLVALAVGPVALAIAPIENGYVRNTGTVIVGSALQLAFVVNIVALVVAIMARVTLDIVEGRLADPMAFQLLLIIPILCMIIAFQIPRVFGVIAEIFGARHSTPAGMLKRIGMVVGGAKLATMMRAMGASRPGVSTSRSSRGGGTPTPNGGSGGAPKAPSGGPGTGGGGSVTKPN
jgi:hypothetical protein